MVESCPKESLKLFTLFPLSSTVHFLIFKPCFLIYVLSVFVLSDIGRSLIWVSHLILIVQLLLLRRPGGSPASSDS